MINLDFSSITEDDFSKYFNTEDECLAYLAYKKWGELFTCKKCGHHNYCVGKTSFSRRCTRCKHDESALVDTIFEGCRFDITKAFQIAFTVCHAIDESSYELSRKLNLRQMTCWSFKKKLTECIKERQDLSPEMKIKLEEIIIQK